MPNIFPSHFFDLSDMDHAREVKILAAFGKNLKKIRLQRGISTRELGHLADMDYGNINEIENGKKNPGLTTIVTLAEALGVDPRDMLPEK